MVYVRVHMFRARTASRQAGPSGRALRAPALSGTRIRRSRLAATALMASALLAVASSATASELTQSDSQSSLQAGTAHRRPPIAPGRALPPAQALRVEVARVRPPLLSPRLCWDSILAHRLRHARDIVRDGPALGLARRVDRLSRGSPPSFLRFHSGQLRAGVPAV